MYQLMVKRDFIAQHYLTVPNSGPENEWHSHHFEAEVLIEGKKLNENGYLVDIVEVNDVLDKLTNRFRDTTLNDIEDFSGLNPSIEHFARIFCTAVAERISAAHLSAVKTTIWEDESAWASYRHTFAG